MNNQMIFLEYEHQQIVEDFYAQLAPNATWTDAVMALKEEVSELFEAIALLNELDESEWDEPEGDSIRAHLAKEIGDVAFTLRGLALKSGIDHDKAFEIVAEDNLRNKVKAESGKVRRKEGYSAPNMESVVL